MTDQEKSDQAAEAEARQGVNDVDDGSENFYNGSEPFFSTFSQTNVDLNTCRLTMNDRVLYPLSDLASQIENLRREFIHTGDAHSALQEVIRVKSQFDQRTQAWERDVQGIERDKRGQSGGAIQRLKSEIARVRGRVNVTGRTVMKLEIALNQLAIESEDSKKEGASTEIDATSDAAAVTDADSAPPGEGAGHREAAGINPSQPDSSLQKRIDVVRQVIATLVGSGLEISYANADRPVTEAPRGREQAWDPGLPLVLVVGWYLPEGSEAESGKLLLRVWLVAKSPAAAQTLVASAGHVRLLLESETTDSRELEFQIAVDSGKQLPRSTLVRKFVDRVLRERFGNSDEHPFAAMVASCNDLSHSETELTLKLI